MLHTSMTGLFTQLYNQHLTLCVHGRGYSPPLLYGSTFIHAQQRHVRCRISLLHAMQLGWPVGAVSLAFASQSGGCEFESALAVLSGSKVGTCSHPVCLSVCLFVCLLVHYYYWPLICTFYCIKQLCSKVGGLVSAPEIYKLNTWYHDVGQQLNAPW